MDDDVFVNESFEKVVKTHFASIMASAGTENPQLQGMIKSALLGMFKNGYQLRKWFDVEDRLPLEGLNVLCAGPAWNDTFHHGHFQITLTRTGMGWVLDDGGEGKLWEGWPITHWQYLPEQPKIKE